MSDSYPPETAAAHGLAHCESCSRVEPVGSVHCPRCHARLHLRKPESLERTIAFTAAATILYIPANLLPVLRLTGVTGNQQNTIIGGVIQFWQTADYPVAIIIFVASVMIPILKILAIASMCLASRYGHRPQAHTRLYRMTELIGRWSMTDIFVVAVLVGVVQLGSVMSIQPGPGAVAFAGVVVLTIFAAMSFDPRLIWDAAARDQTHES